MRKVSIVVPVFNAERTIAKTLGACLAQSYFPECTEIIVVDDGSSDHTSQIASKYPVRYLFQSNSGPAKARNLGWKNAQGEIIFFTDADCVPEKDWITKMLPLFDADNIAAVGGTYDICNPDSLVALCVHNEIQYRHSRLPEYVRYLGSFNVAIRKSAFADVNGFDESFKIACGEDADLSYRLTDKGYILRFSRDCRVGHYFPAKTSKYLRQQFWRGFWVMKHLIEHRGKVCKDDYSGTRDAVQPPLFLMILLLLPLCYMRSVFIMWVILNIAAIFINSQIVLFAVRKQSNLKMLYIYPLLYFRGFFWAAGCSVGFIKHMFDRLCLRGNGMNCQNTKPT